MSDKEDLYELLKGICRYGKDIDLEVKKVLTGEGVNQVADDLLMWEKKQKRKEGWREH